MGIQSHLTEDLTDNAITWLQQQKSLMPDKSFFMYSSARPCLHSTTTCGSSTTRTPTGVRRTTSRRSTPRSWLAEKNGATCVDATYFTYLGGQVRSLLSLISYLGTGEYRERYLGVEIPPTNLQPDGDDAARAFAGALADRVATAP